MKQMTKIEGPLVFAEKGNQSRRIAVHYSLVLDETGRRDWETLEDLPEVPLLAVSGAIEELKDGRWVEVTKGDLSRMTSIDPEKYDDGAILAKLLDAWRNYDLNEHMGTKAQECLIEQENTAAQGWNRYGYSKENYEVAKAILEKRGLLVDRGYEFGSGWLVQKIPKNVIEFLLASVSWNKPKTR